MEEGPEVDATRPVRTPSDTVWGLLVLVAVSFGVVALISGLVVWWEYLPAAALPVCVHAGDICPGNVGGRRAAAAQDSVLLATTVLAIGLAVWAAVRAVRSHRLRPVGAAIAASAAGALALVASVGATSLRWNQVALWAVGAVPPSRYRGFAWLFDDRADGVRFAIVGGTETGVDTLRRWAVVHASGSVAAFVVLGLALWLLRPASS